MECEWSEPPIKIGLRMEGIEFKMWSVTVSKVQPFYVEQRSRCGSTKRVPKHSGEQIHASRSCHLSLEICVVTVRFKPSLTGPLCVFYIEHSL